MPVAAECGSERPARWAAVALAPYCGGDDSMADQFCASCGSRLPADARFCPQCARPVPPAGAPAPPAVPRPWDRATQGKPDQAPRSGSITDWTTRPAPQAASVPRQAGLRRPKSIAFLVLAAGLALLWMAVDGPAPTNPVHLPGGDPVTVTYQLGGTATGASVITYVDGSGNIEQLTNKAVPLVRSASGQHGLSITAHHGQFLSFSAQNAGTSGTLDCSIEADGVQINSGHADGGYAFVTCSATVP